jgi:hypothetical protein
VRRARRTLDEQLAVRRDEGDVLAADVLALQDLPSAGHRWRLGRVAERNPLRPRLLAPLPPPLQPLVQLCRKVIRVTLYV